MIEVNHVSRSFGSFRAVDDVSFSIRKGEIVGLLGPNGAGKTTTMRMITGFLNPTEGSVLIDGADPQSDPRAVKHRIGYMPESAPLYGDMMVQEYLEYVSRVQGVDPDEKLPGLARECGIREVMHKNIAELSRGYRQRVGLAHALLHDPEILILDEPTSGLDPNQIIEVRKLVKEIGRTRTVIISTHILSEVEMLCDRVIIISRGRIVADSPTAELRGRFGEEAVVRIAAAGCTAESLCEACADIDGVRSCTQTASGEQDTAGKPLATVILSVSGGRDVRPDVFARIRDRNLVLYEMSMQRTSLEDVFRSLTTEGDAS
ncbi:MAG TPA: ATP-binding cassette domain-containing protein [Treponemataceae bacterium]|jgi:ABC-2 type transport system ATP-binding protein|nr:ATP-binding cassette domain-containing protein [Treponemataceae bacterium]HQB88535.1 ATP-binding cassette domain-containing protein [Treponemataceae bacterium]HRR02230.1 ATP-binding cassette domain-containing protein [Treponemataceae bacterium]